MRHLLIVAALAAAVAGSVCTAPPSTASPIPLPPFVSRVHWVASFSLQVYPTRAGRDASRAAASDAQADEAWSEVLALAPDAGTPGMREQFLCHWHFAELAQPGKTSWNLEPWRPVVSDEAMVNAGCNPGGAEESS